MNLLEKLLSAVYFKDVGFPWVTLYLFQKYLLCKMYTVYRRVMGRVVKPLGQSVIAGRMQTETNNNTLVL